MNKLLLHSVLQAIIIIFIFTFFFASVGVRWPVAILGGFTFYALLALIFHFLTLPFYIIARIRGAVYVPSADDRITSMLRLAKVKKGIKVADLGSGDGRVMAAFAKAGAVVDGYEINPMLVRRSRQLLKNAGFAARTKVFWQSFWDVNLGAYDIIVVYGIPYIMKELGEKLRKELKPKARVLSNAFTFPDWKPNRVDGEVREYLPNSK